MSIITFSIIDELGNDVFIKVKDNVAFNIVARNYKERNGPNFMFKFNGVLLNESHTIAQLNIRNNNNVYAIKNVMINLTVIKNDGISTLTIGLHSFIFDNLASHDYSIILCNNCQISKLDTCLSLKLKDDDIVEVFS